MADRQRGTAVLKILRIRSFGYLHFIIAIRGRFGVQETGNTADTP